MSSFEYLFGNVDERGRLDGDDADYAELRESLEQSGDYLSRILASELSAIAADDAATGDLGASGTADVAAGVIAPSKDAVDFSNIAEDDVVPDETPTPQSSATPFHQTAPSSDAPFFGTLSKDAEGNIASSVFGRRHYVFTDDDLEARFPGYKSGRIRFSDLYVKPEASLPHRNYFYSHFQFMAASNQFSTASLEPHITIGNDTEPTTAAAAVDAHNDTEKTSTPLGAMQLSKRNAFLAKRAAAFNVRYQPYLYLRDDREALRAEIPISTSTRPSQGRVLLQLINHLKSLETQLNGDIGNGSTSTTNGASHDDDHVIPADDVDPEIDPGSDSNGSIDGEEDFLMTNPALRAKLRQLIRNTLRLQRMKATKEDTDKMDTKHDTEELSNIDTTGEKVGDDDVENVFDAAYDSDETETSKRRRLDSNQPGTGSRRFFQLANVKPASGLAAGGSSMTAEKNADRLYERYSPYILPMTMEDSILKRASGKENESTATVDTQPVVQIVPTSSNASGVQSSNVKRGVKRDDQPTPITDTPGSVVPQTVNSDTDDSNFITRSGSQRFAEHVRPMKMPKWYPSAISAMDPSLKIKIMDDSSFQRMETIPEDDSVSMDITETSGSQNKKKGNSVSTTSNVGQPKNTSPSYVLPSGGATLFSVYFDEWDDRILWDDDSPLSESNDALPTDPDYLEKARQSISLKIATKVPEVMDKDESSPARQSAGVLSAIRKEMEMVKDLARSSLIIRRADTAQFSNASAVKNSTAAIMKNFPKRDVRFDLFNWERDIVWDDTKEESTTKSKTSSGQKVGSTKATSTELQIRPDRSKNESTEKYDVAYTQNGAYVQDDNDFMQSLIDWDELEARLAEVSDATDYDSNSDEDTMMLQQGNNNEDREERRRRRRMELNIIKKRNAAKELFIQMLAASSRELVFKYFTTLEKLHSVTSESIAVGKRFMVNSDGEVVPVNYSVFGETHMEDDGDDDDDEDIDDGLVFGDAAQAQARKILSKKLKEFWTTYFDMDGNPIKPPASHVLKSRYHGSPRLFNLAPIEVAKLPTIKDPNGDVLKYMSKVLSKIGDSSRAAILSSDLTASLASTGTIQPNTALGKRAIDMQKTNSRHAMLLTQSLLSKFNLSQDKSYERAAQSKSDRVRQMYGPASLVHSPAALKLHPLLYRTCHTRHEIRYLHRSSLRVTRRMFNTEVPILSIRGRKKMKKASSKELSERMKSVKDITLKDGSDFILLEYSEERPPLMANSGMGSLLYNYYRKLNDADDYVPDLSLGGPYLLETTDTTPFPGYGEIYPGETIQVIQNNMTKAPLFRHSMHPTDLLCVRQSLPNGECKYMLRTIMTSFVVGQTIPIVEVPMPQSRRVPLTVKTRLQGLIYRLCRRDARKWFDYAKLMRLYSAIPEHQFKARLKELAVMAKKLPGGLSMWKLRPHVKVLPEDDIRKAITPEMWCCYEAMLQTQQFLKDITMGDLLLPEEQFAIMKSFGTMSDLKDLEDTVAAWNLTKNFIVAANNRAFVRVYGAGDPTGCGQAAAWTKATAKQPLFTSLEFVQAKRDWCNKNNVDYEETSDDEFLLGKRQSRNSEYDTVDIYRHMPPLHGSGTTNDSGQKLTITEQQQVFKDEVNRVWLLQKRSLSRVDLGPARSATGLPIPESDTSAIKEARLRSVSRFLELKSSTAEQESNPLLIHDSNDSSGRRVDSKLRDANRDDDHDENLDIDLAQDVMTNDKARLRYTKRHEWNAVDVARLNTVNVDDEDDENNMNIGQGGGDAPIVGQLSTVDTTSTTQQQQQQEHALESDVISGTTNNDSTPMVVDDQPGDVVLKKGKKKGASAAAAAAAAAAVEAASVDAALERGYDAEKSEMDELYNGYVKPRRFTVGRTLSIQRHYKDGSVRTEVVSDPRVLTAYLQEKSRLEAQKKHVAQLRKLQEQRRVEGRMQSQAPTSTDTGAEDADMEGDAEWQRD